MEINFQFNSHCQSNYSYLIISKYKWPIVEEYNFWKHIQLFVIAVTIDPLQNTAPSSTS